MVDPSWIGFGAALLSCLSFGSYAVPIKGPTANRVNIDPLCMQTYKTIVCLLTSAIVLIASIIWRQVADYAEDDDEGRIDVYYYWTPLGFASGLFWVPGGTAGIFAIRNAGLAVSQGTYSALKVAVALVWGLCILSDRVRSETAAIVAGLMMMLGLWGMANFSNGSRCRRRRREGREPNSDDDLESYESMEEPLLLMASSSLTARTEEEWNIMYLMGDSPNTFETAADDFVEDNPGTRVAVAVASPAQCSDLLSDSPDHDDMNLTDTISREESTNSCETAQHEEVRPPEEQRPQTGTSRRSSDEDNNDYGEETKDVDNAWRAVGSDDGHDRARRYPAIVNDTAVVGAGMSTQREIIAVFDAPRYESPDPDDVITVFKSVRLRRGTLGLMFACVDGLWGGSILVPMHFCPPVYRGLPFLWSFATGATCVLLSMWLIRFLYSVWQFGGNIVLAWFNLPSLHVSRMWKPGAVAGFLWSIGNVTSMISVEYLGEGLGYSIVQGQMMVAGAWGILYYREVQGCRNRTCWFLFAALTLGGILLLSHEHIKESSH